MIRLLPLLALACGDKGEDTEAATGPDITGDYNTFIEGVTGCDGDPAWVQDWAEGPLRVSGSPDQLTFDFQGGVTFSGSIDGAANFIFFGPLEWNGANLDVSQRGVAVPTQESWDLDGRFEILIDDDGDPDNDCTFTAEFTANALGGT
jgi:hypothetical protein